MLLRYVAGFCSCPSWSQRGTWSGAWGLKEVHFASQQRDLGSPEVDQRSKGRQGLPQYSKIQVADYPASCWLAEGLESEQHTVPPGFYSQSRGLVVVFIHISAYWGREAERQVGALRPGLWHISCRYKAKCSAEKWREWSFSFLLDLCSQLILYEQERFLVLEMLGRRQEKNMFSLFMY